MNKKNIYLYSFLALIGSVLAIYFAALFDSVLLKQKLESMNIFYIIKYVASSNNAWKLFLILLVAIILFVFVTAMQDSKDYQSKQIFVTPDISTPAVAGQGQCGTAKWLPPEKFDTSFDNFILDQNNPTLKKIQMNSLNDIKQELKRITALEEEIDKLTKEQEQEEDDTRIEELEALIDIKQHELTDEDKIIYDVTNPTVYDDIKKEIKRGALNNINPQKGGIVLGKKDLEEKKVINSLFKLVSGVPFSQERIYYILKDVHTLVLGATRSGKGRTVVLQTIGTLLLAGESIIVTDPKAESYFYYKKILELLGYKTITIDFKNPRKSTRFNFLQPIIDRVDEDDIPGAIDATWDLVSQLVGEPKGERLWNDGEASTIAACAMSVVYDNRSPENHKYRNLTNVYYFLSQMCTPIQVGKELVLPISKYVQDLPYEHPSKGLLAVADIAPSRTRGSFYTSALMTLKLFTNPLIADMTSSTDYDPMKVGDRKTAIFIILPDDRKTYYSLATLYVTQQYQLLSRAADLRGGRLKRRTNYILDEFGNFAKIPNFTTMQTVGGGKGIRFNILVQDYNQIDDIYENTQGKIIRSNCENWIYLQTDDPDTLEGLSKKLGNYTISTYSLTANHQKFSNPSSSHNVSLTGRELLKPDEIKDIKRPYTLVTSRNDPAILNSPDLSNWYFNSMLGLGNEEHNRRVRMARDNIRPQRSVSPKLELWGIWDEYKVIMVKEQKDKTAKAMKEMAEQVMAAQSNQFFDS
ncbi:type IV secretory system conjugative DNA transfer family protein [Anaerocolumna sp. AGMB13020]|uniref:VirD4-like conjugal transfer protein, CD1115 family n=1 Tax=Anaerocolumna sp. AGMB13020 TaxID=3081750 RepID=UPI0029546786|nr:type IV secretory system conjugative DNA transfer family protein [Anaerocolumna sp. AGMB13020]WOO35762.1 type IV secretory system conjugative DNA transfer family protein [Anaerocolumna sp. AGMB13020]